MTKKQMTNRDVIDKMTNEELAAILDCNQCAYYDSKNDKCTKNGPEARGKMLPCVEGIAKWLGRKADFGYFAEVKKEWGV